MLCIASMLTVQYHTDVVQEPGFATVGRPVRTASLNQPQMTLPHHQPLQDLELISSAALLQAHVAAQAQAQNNAAQSAGGSGSVVYENSYNSFQRPFRLEIRGRDLSLADEVGVNYKSGVFNDRLAYHSLVATFILRTQPSHLTYRLLRLPYTINHTHTHTHTQHILTTNVLHARFDDS
ncbi:unnamed protein product [Taenia asiatica]|uniref:TonB-dependent receptor n=1 Tax=Taenia asiatica TaxID=60517 RepID=A0A0R3VY93_TAEAS|nr:unnamed protein product [Taenia asiatica]